MIHHQGPCDTKGNCRGPYFRPLAWFIIGLFAYLIPVAEVAAQDDRARLLFLPSENGSELAIVGGEGFNERIITNFILQWEECPVGVADCGFVTEGEQPDRFLGGPLDNIFTDREISATNFNSEIGGSDALIRLGTVVPPSVGFAEFSQRLVTRSYVARLGTEQQDLQLVNSCDFIPGGEVCGVDDIDALTGLGDLTEGIPAGSFELRRFDLEFDGMIDTNDLEAFLLLASEANIGPQAAPYLRGDTDLDARVQFNDFLAISTSFGTRGNVWSSGDFDGNGLVDFTDFLSVSTNFGKSNSEVTNAVATVPEPSMQLPCILAAFIGFLSFLRQPRRP